MDAPGTPDSRARAELESVGPCGGAVRVDLDRVPACANQHEPSEVIARVADVGLAGRVDESPVQPTHTSALGVEEDDLAGRGRERVRVPLADLGDLVADRLAHSDRGGALGRPTDDLEGIRPRSGRTAVDHDRVCARIVEHEPSQIGAGIREPDVSDSGGTDKFPRQPAYAGTLGLEVDDVACLRGESGLVDL